MDEEQRAWVTYMAAATISMSAGIVLSIWRTLNQEPISFAHAVIMSMFTGMLTFIYLDELEGYRLGVKLVVCGIAALMSIYLIELVMRFGKKLAKEGPQEAFNWLRSFIRR